MPLPDAVLPVSFSPALVAAVRAGRKTVTRRRFPGLPGLLEAPDRYRLLELDAAGAHFEDVATGCRLPGQACPLGPPGQRLHLSQAPELELVVTAVGVERVRAITAAGARAEGIRERPPARHEPGGARWGGVAPDPAGGFHWHPDPVTAFAHLLGGFYPGAWERNAWVWVVGFRVLAP
ncbi:hypothetical protein KLP40_13335 [Hymenobacter sp. NST-14]|uniref:hypothetical protein n=1 Tax=Hymenobacter piscis TaxID=2839984 RepID=UPI001C026B74|nr:hypothetical protein [Hymenobacter piscis]MBT9394150.1 hypothetical protein [Hymenobacter piscis]